MRNLRTLLIKISDALCTPFYKYLFCFPFSLKVGKYPIYKQIQYLHFFITRKYKAQSVAVDVKLNKFCSYPLEICPGKDFHQMHLFMTGYYEKRISEKILDDLKDAEVFIDVGAYIGYYSLMASVAYPGVHVYAFEPQKEAFYMLGKNAERNNKSINVYNCALGEINENKQLNINKFPEQSSLLSSNLQVTNNYIVSVKRLDDLLDFRNKNIVLKIDTEGYEFEALKGMTEMVKNNNCIIYFEYNPKIYKQQFGQNYSQSFFQFLNEGGYKIFNVETKGIEEEIFYNCQQLLQQNLIARKIT